MSAAPPGWYVDPEDDASVPFRYDVHALIFSYDAVGLESQFHQALASKRVNLVNTRREFFYASVGEVRDLLVGTVGTALLEFEERPPSEEYRASQNLRRAMSSTASDAGLSSPRGPADSSGSAS